MIDDWKQWAQKFLVLLKETENAKQEGKPGDTAEQSARLKELEAELQTKPGYLALRSVNLKGPLEAAASAVDSGAALAELRDRLSIALMPLSRWHKQPEPAPVLWRNADNQWADAVLSEGEVAMLSGPGGIGKSYLALAWSLAATQNPDAGIVKLTGCRGSKPPH